MQIQINNCRLFFDVYGSKLQVTKDSVKSKPTLIVIHGGPGLIDHTLFVDFWSQFVDIAQVLFIDQRANGRSERTDPTTWNLNQWGDDLYQFCSTLGIEKPIVAGISWGGHVLSSYATRYPEHPGGLIFCDTEARFDIERVANGFAKRGGPNAYTAAKEFLTNPSIDSGMKYEKECLPYYSHKSYSKAEMERSIVNQELFTYYCLGEAHTFNYIPALANICCPSLVIGGEDAPMHVPESLAEIANALPTELVEYHSIKNAGSPVFLDAETSVYNIVKTFLENNFPIDNAD